MTSRKLVYTALFAALTAAGAFLRIPLGVSSITLQFLFTAMAGVLLGAGCGALSQAVYVSLADGGVDYVVVGIGVNLRQRPEDFSPEVAKIATSLAAEGYDVERETLETALVDALRQAFRHLCAPETYLDDYRQLCLNLGRQVHVLQTDETVTALDIDPQYGLVVRHGSGAVETLRCGEVSVRGLYGYAE